MNADIVFQYFPELTEKQQQQFLQLEDLYQDWNQKINVVSRKDIDELRKLYNDKMRISQLKKQAMDLRIKGGVGMIPDQATNQEILRISGEIDRLESHEYEIFLSGSGYNQLESMYGYDPIPDSEE